MTTKYQNRIKGSGFTHQNFSRKNLGGFTLLETMVAIAILLVAVVTPISLIGDSLSNLYYARDQMIAVNLAQEGIEMVRQVRDSEKLGGGAGAFTSALTPGDYVVDPYSFFSTSGVSGIKAGLISCPSCSDSNKVVALDSVRGLYRQNFPGGTATQFRRVVNISSSGLGSDERKVTATVTWRTGNKTGTIAVEEYLFDWSL